MVEGISHAARVFRNIGVIWIVGWAAVPVFGLQINVNYMQLPNELPHTEDLNGNKLTDIVEAAAQHYTDIIGDAHALNLTISWADLSDASGPGVLGIAGIPNQSGHISNASILFDTKLNGNDRQWYFDDTPFDDDEYLMTQVLYASSHHRKHPTATMEPLPIRSKSATSATLVTPMHLERSTYSRRPCTKSHTRWDTPLP